MRQGAAAANAGGVNLAFLGRQRLLPPDPAAADLGRSQPPAGLLQGRRRGPDRPRAAGAHHGQLEPGAGQQPRVDTHRLHVPVGRGQGRHGGHRRVVVVLRRLQPQRRPHLPQGDPRRVRPLRARPSRARTTSTCWPTHPSRASPTGPTSPTTRRRATAAACWPAARPASCRCSRPPALIPPNVVPGAIPGVTDVIRRAMENVYGRFGLGPATSLRQLERELDRGLHRGRRRGGRPPAPPRPEPAPRRPPLPRRMTPLSAPGPLRSTPSHDEPRHRPHPGAPPARLGRAGGRRPHRAAAERLLLVRRHTHAALGRRTSPSRPPPRRPRRRPPAPSPGVPAPGGSGPAAARHGGEDRQLPRRPAPVGPRQGRHRLRGARRGRHHPLRRRVPVPGRRADRPRPLGPQHRHRHPRAAGQPARGPRRRHQPGARQHQRLPDRQRRHREQRLAHDPPARPRAPRLRTTPRPPSSTAPTRP